MEGHFPFPINRLKAPFSSATSRILQQGITQFIQLQVYNTTLFFGGCIVYCAQLMKILKAEMQTLPPLSWQPPPCLLNVDKLLLLHQTGSVNHCEKIWLRKILPSMMNTKLSQQRFLRCLENGLIKRTARRNLYEFIYYVGFPLLWLMVYPVQET